MMSTFQEIELAASKLPATEKQELLLQLASSLRLERSQLPSPRVFTKKEMMGWIIEDEKDMATLRANR